MGNSPVDKIQNFFKGGFCRKNCSEKKLNPMFN